MIGTHRIQRNRDSVTAQFRIEILLPGDNDRPPVVKSAVGANPVHQLRLAAIRACHHRGDTCFVVRSSFSSSGFGMFSFWIWHYIFLIIYSLQLVPAQAGTPFPGNTKI